MIGMIGEVLFSVSEKELKTFKDLKRDTSARYTDHEVIGAKPKREFLGSNLDNVSFSMELSIFRGVSPIELEETLRDYCEKGEEQTLIIGGKNFGDFSVESLSASYETVENNGLILRARIDITLKEYR